jgi:hypothetical protein
MPAPTMDDIGMPPIVGIAAPGGISAGMPCTHDPAHAPLTQRLQTCSPTRLLTVVKLK